MKLNTYQLKKNVGKHYVHGKFYRSGDPIKLTKVQAEKIRDKLENSPLPITAVEEPTIETKEASPPAAKVAEPPTPIAASDRYRIIKNDQGWAIVDTQESIIAFKEIATEEEAKAKVVELTAA